MLRLRGTQARTQTVVLSRPAARQTHLSYRIMLKRRDGDGSGPPSGPESNDIHSKTPISAPGALACDDIAHIYASFRINSLRRAYGPYHIIGTKDAHAKMQELIDPAEFKVYEPLLFDNKNLILPLIEDVSIRKRLRVGVEILLVRCKNNSLHLIVPFKLRNTIAKARYQYETAEKTAKEQIGKTNNYTFEREQRDITKHVRNLESCASKTNPSCATALDEICNSDSKYPHALKAVYKYGVSQTGKANRTWEEVCFDTNPARSKSNPRTVGKETAMPFALPKGSKGTKGTKGSKGTKDKATQLAQPAQPAQSNTVPKKDSPPHHPITRSQTNASRAPATRPTTRSAAKRTPKQ